MAGVEVTWNGVSSTTIPELVFENPTRSLLGKTNGNFVDIPGRRGAWFFPQLRGRRQIVINGFILADTFPTGRRDAVTALADWLDVDVQARLILGDEPTVYYEAALTDVGDTEEWRQLGTFQLTWEVQPYSLALATTQLILAGTNSYTHSFDPDLLTDVYPVIEIKPTNGTITRFDFELNDDTISWEGTLTSGNTITISSVIPAVLLGTNDDLELTGAFNSTNLSMARVYGSFGSLRPGTNELTFTRQSGTATAVTITITYRKAYRK